mmetsp:Transcript_80485/g.163028  ORF Transcript_80485/g.163028 Transcript_80485/m.163028 type:complete len:208 (-) Transcript_80485:76-699(-)
MCRSWPLLVAGLATALAAEVDLATFDGKAPHTWHAENDPVMGGRSESTWTLMDGFGDWSGVARIVPSLNAPGFTIAMTGQPLLGSFPDVSAEEGLLLGLRNVDGNITNFKVAFCDSRILPFHCQLQSFKADFSLERSQDFKEVFVPWSAFSDKWSASTGKHTAEEPPTAVSLKHITQLQIWVEGIAGTFHLLVKYVRAGSAPTELLV